MKGEWPHEGERGQDRQCVGRRREALRESLCSWEDAEL